MSEQIKRPVRVEDHPWCHMLRDESGQILAEIYGDGDEDVSKPIADESARCINAYPKLLAALREASSIMEYWALRDDEFNAHSKIKALLRELDGEGT